jgi:glycerol dehydrogenase
VCEKFGGECCRSEIDRVAELVRKSGCGLVVGVGGGKTIDVAKMASNELDIPYFIAPTSASTDAPVSCIAVIYTDKGEHDSVASLKRAAEMVLMDSEIIVKAPMRLFKAGMADALATWFEAQARERSDTPNNIGKGYRQCKAGMAIARLSFDLLMEDGLKALQALENGIITEAVENIIETNTLLSGLGFQNTGCSVAHAIHAGLAELPQTHGYMHGEKVAFGIVCGFIFENTPKELVDPVMRFMVAAGLPVTLEELNVKPSRENAFKIADKVVNRNKTIYAEPLVITVDTVLAAVLAANALGEAYKNGKGLI